MKNQFNLNPLHKAWFVALLSTSVAVPAYANVDLTDAIAANITASAENTPSEGKLEAFDDNQYSKWLTFESTGWINYDFGQTVSVNQYTITSANDAPSRDPRNWTLQGLTNNGWVTLDTQTNQDFPSRYQKQSYSLNSTAQVSQLRLDVTANSGAGILQLAELEFIGTTDGGGGTDPNLPFSDQGSLAQYQWQHYGPFNAVEIINATTSGTGDIDLYMRRGAPATTKQYDCQSISPTGNEDCSLSGNDIYISVYGYTDVNFQINVNDSGIGDPIGDWVAPTVDFIDMNPETQGSQLVKRIIGDPSGYMARRCIDVAKVLYTDPKESERFFRLRFELRAKDAWGNDFVAYKTGQDGSGEMTIAVSTSHLERLYREGGNSDSAIKNEIDGILFHEITHGYNNSPLTTDSYGDGGPFWAYTEGLADAVRIGAGFHKTRQPDVNGSRQWLGGYTTSGFFLHYVKEKHDPLFIRKFNQAAKDMGNYSWSWDASFRAILGRGVQDVWNEYKNYINNGGQLDY